MINEGVYRSPKWLRNIFDFEVSTGEDIKGKPSKRRLAKQEKERKERLAKEEEERKERLAKEEKEWKEKFSSLFEKIQDYIKIDYQKCKITIPEDQKLKIEQDGLNFRNKNLSFTIVLNNEYRIPEFDVFVKYGEVEYNCRVKGLDFLGFKIFLVDEVYAWYKSSSNKYQQKKKEEPKKKPMSEDENKRRRYSLLKQTLEGHQRKWKEILEWERKNPGKTHPDKISTKNEIENVKSRIEEMRNKFQYESFRHLKSFGDYVSD